MGSLNGVEREKGIHAQSQSPLKVLVVGAGLGGLSCAISCLKQGLGVEILEKAKELGEIGAGIQIPPNATRVMAHFGLVPKIEEAQAVKVMQHRLLHYADGTLVFARPGGEWMEERFGHPWYVIHRADYHRVLVAEARRLGAEILLDQDVTDVDFDAPSVFLSTGERRFADAIIGADGLRSTIRDRVLGYHLPPTATGDMAYRATIPRSQIEGLNDPYWSTTLDDAIVRNWTGQNSHAVFYPVRGKTVWNLVLLRPDDLPSDVFTETADVQEMRELFQDWDPRLNVILTRVKGCLKWKVCHMHELDTWVKGSAALLGDACHPTLPYQSQGAAMAVEDGAVLGVLLGLLSERSKTQDCRPHIPAVLSLYEGMRKKRTTTNVEGAMENRRLFHMVDGPEKEERNKALNAVDFSNPDNRCVWGWGDMPYQRRLMGFDTIEDARSRFRAWAQETGL